MPDYIERLRADEEITSAGKIVCGMPSTDGMAEKLGEELGRCEILF